MSSRLAPSPARRRVRCAILSLVACLGLSFVAKAQLTTGPDPSTYYAGLRQQMARDRSPEPTLTRLLADLARSATPASFVDDFSSCPVTPPAGIPGVTNPGFYFLSEILPAGIAPTDATCGHLLRCFLGQMVAHQQAPAANPPSPHSDATLIVDRMCTVEETLVLPNRFVLAGVGIEGRGVLVFDLPDGQPAVRFAPAADSDSRFVTIRDLNLVGASCCGQVGIDVRHSSLVSLERVRLHGFGYGVVGEMSYSIHIDDSAIHDNGIDLVLGEDSTAWRVRDTLIKQSGLIGAVFLPSARGNLFSGVRVEQNPITGIYQRGLMNVVENGWFEGNGIGFGDHGIQHTASARHNRVLGNLFSTEDVLAPAVTQTQLCFNVDGGLALNNC
jgi:hypothetical protein